ncbi:MAG: ATP-binding protein, partial [Flavobacteriaceae bacterium]
LPIYLESILNNLFSNAIKFRKQDKNPVIVISAKKQRFFTIVKIEDNGIGIDLDKYKDQIFTPYRTGTDNSSTRGMGLYLVKYQIELMKGKIEVESTVGEGTSFHLYFPNQL